MEAVITETLDYPLRHFGLENSQSSTSNHLVSDGEETEVKHDDLIEKIKKLSFEDVLDSTYRISNCSNNISEVTLQVKDNFGILAFGKNTEVDEIHLSFKNKKISKVVEADKESTFCKCSNKNYEISSGKKNNTEKGSFVENLENDENRLSLSLKNNKLLNEYSKSGSSISSGDESDSDDDDQVESVILRERNPIKHNRSEPNKEHRANPFSRNHRKTSELHFNSNNYHTLGNSNSHILYDFKTLHDFASICYFNSTDFETYGIVSPNKTVSSFSPRETIPILHSDFPTSESVTYKTFEETLPSTVADDIFNNLIPRTTANPSTATDQKVDVIPCSVLDSDIGNLNNKFFEEIIDSPRLDNLKESIFLGSSVNNVEKETFLDSRVEDITEEELKNIINLSDSTLCELSSQNLVNLIDESLLNLPSSKETKNVFIDPILNKNTSDASPVKEVSYLNKNQHNFHPESDRGHSYFPKSKVEESSFFSHLCTESCIFEKVGQLCNHEYFVNDPIKNITAISCGSVSPQITDYTITSIEIEKEIVKVKEKKALSISELSCEIDWNLFPFELDDLECKETQENKKDSKKDDYEAKDINKTCKSPYKTEKTKIGWILSTTARDKLFNSSSFCKRKWEEENEKIRQQIESGMLGTKKNKVIYVLKKHWKTKYRGTNLHNAILSGFTERVFCLVEWHKKCHDGITEINLRDSFNKTVLDYSKEKGMDLLTDYLKENTAKESINI